MEGKQAALPSARTRGYECVWVVAGQNGAPKNAVGGNLLEMVQSGVRVVPLVFPHRAWHFEQIIAFSAD